MIVYIQNCNLSQIPLVISTGDSWLNPAKYFEACHRIIMTNILAKQVSTLGLAGLVPGDQTGEGRAGDSQAPGPGPGTSPRQPLHSHPPEPVPCPPRVGAGRWHSQAGAGGQ